MENFKFILGDFNWDYFFGLTNWSSDCLFDLFFNVFYDIFQVCFPFTNVNIGTKIQNKWFSSELAMLKKEVMTARLLVKINNNTINKKLYVEMNKRYKSAIKKARINANVNIIESSENNNKAAWS